MIPRGNWANFVFFAVCDKEPPTIEVSVDGTEIANGTRLDLRTFDLEVVVRDNIALDTMVIGINYDYEIIHMPRCPLGGTTTYVYSQRISEDLAIDKLTIRILMIKIVATDWCGHQVVFYFRLTGPSRGLSVSSPILYLAMYGIGLISTGTVILALSLIRKRTLT